MDAALPDTKRNIREIESWREDYSDHRSKYTEEYTFWRDLSFGIKWQPSNNVWSYRYIIAPKMGIEKKIFKL